MSISGRVADKDRTQGLIGESVRPSTDTLVHGDTKHLLFAASTYILVGLIWFGACITLYAYGSGFHSNVPYEGRWFLSLFVLTSVLCIVFHVSRCEMSLISVAVCGIYTTASCILAIVIYSINLNMASANHTPPNRPTNNDKRVFIQVSSIMVTLSVFGVCLCGPWLFYSLYKLCIKHCGDYGVSSGVIKYLVWTSGIEFLLGCYSIYVTCEIMSIKFSPIHTYMVQELFCGILLIITCLLQCCILVTQNKLFVKFLMVLNLCHFFQELFYAWNAYYISLYIHSSQMRLAYHFEYDHIVMTINFTGHFMRLCLLGYGCWMLYETTIMERERLTVVSEGVSKMLVGLASVSLALGGVHVIVDMGYTSLEHLYRTLISFTGISVFYCSLLGVCLSLFLRTRHLIFFSLACVFSVLLLSVSLHAIYIYLVTSFSGSLVFLLENLGMSKVGPSLFHFVEALLAFIGVVLSLVVTFVLLRILHSQSKHEPLFVFGLPWLILKYCAYCILGLNIIETGLLLRVKMGWKGTDTTLGYAVLDILSTYFLSILQIGVTWRNNRHIYLSSLTLLFLLLSEVLTTFNYLSAYTTYTQLLIMLSKMSRPKSMTSASSFHRFFPLSHIGLMICAHVIQLVQWILTIASLISCAMMVERMKRTPVTNSDHPNGRQLQPVATNSAGQTFYINMAYDPKQSNESEVT